MSKNKARTVELQIVMSEQSEHRFKAMQDKTGASATEVVNDAFRTYEEALRMATDSEKKGGVVYLVVKYPDGTTEEKPIFEQQDS